MKDNGTKWIGIATVGFGLVLGGLVIMQEPGEAKQPTTKKETTQPRVESGSIKSDITKKETGATSESLTAIVKLGTGVTDREIEGEQTSFSFTKGTLGKIYCWSRIKGSQEETEVTHVWSLNGKKLAEVPLKVKGEGFRTWSSKLFTETMTGEGQVEILDADGQLIESLEFTVSPFEEKISKGASDLMSMNDKKNGATR